MLSRLARARAASWLLVGWAFILASATSNSLHTVFLNASSDGIAKPGTALVGALNDPNVKEIVLDGDYGLSRDLDLPQVQLTRNVTITSAPGSMHTLDLNFATGGAALCSTCVLLLHSMTIANAQRLQSMPFFRGDAGSRIIVQDAVITQLACAPQKASISILQDAPRSRFFPASATGAQQDVQMVNGTFQGHPYHDGVYMRDLAMDVPLELLEKEVYSGGIALAYRNVTRICFNAVKDSCLNGKSLLHCLDEMIIDLEELNATSGDGSQDSEQQQLSPGAIAGAVIGGLAGLLLLLTVCAAFVLRRRRRQEHLQQGDSLKAASAAEAAGVGWGSGSVLESADRSPVLMNWSVGSFSAESINPWACHLRKAASATKGAADNRGSSGEWHQVGDIESPGQASDTVASGDIQRRSLDSRGQRLTAAISNKVRHIHEHRLAAAMGVTAAAAESGEERRQRKLSHGNTSCKSAASEEGDSDGGNDRAAAADEEEFQVKDVLGRGGFGVVYKAVWNGTTVAVKIMHLPPGSKAVSAAAHKDGTGKSLLWQAMHNTCSEAKSNGQNSALEDMAVQEAAISSSMAHPNIVAVYKVSLKPIRHHHMRDLAAGPSVRPRAPAAAAARSPAAADGAASSSSRDDSGGTGDSAAAAADLDLVPWEMQLIMEFCDQGTLRDVLDAQLIFDRSTGANHIPTVLSLAQQVARAMHYLHKEHVLHGDLKANNVLLKSVAPTGLGRSDSLTGSCAANLMQQQPELALQQMQQPADVQQDIPLGTKQQQQQQQGDDGALPGCDLQWLPLKGCTVTAKVSDFGLSTLLDPANTHITRLGPGTLTHTAPEMLIHGHCSRASDVYAYGMLLYELATGNRVFADVPRALLGHFVVQQQLRPRWPAALSKSPAWAGILQLTALCWAQHPPARPSFSEILAELGQLARGGQLSVSITERLKQAGRCPSVSPVFPLLVPGAGGMEDVDGSFSLARVPGSTPLPAETLQLAQQLLQQQQQLQQQAAGKQATSDASLLLVPLDSSSAEEAEIVRMSLQEAEAACSVVPGDAAAAGGQQVFLSLLGQHASYGVCLLWLKVTRYMRFELFVQAWGRPAA